jgi:hypothetical protein
MKPSLFWPALLLLRPFREALAPVLGDIIERSGQGGRDSGDLGTSSYPLRAK